MAAAAPWVEGRRERLGVDRAERVAPVVRADDVERRCAELARAGGAVRRALAALAGRFVARRSWERLGYARLGEYARERLGLSARELQDLARVDAALPTLPRVEASLVSGALPWTKVRLIARAAKPEEDRAWIEFARRVSVRQLEQHVRSIDAGCVEAGAADPDPDTEEGRRRGVSLFVPPETHVKWQLGWRLARRVAGEALSVDRAAEQMCAEVLSALPLAPETEEAAELENGEGVFAPRAMTSDERRGARWEQRRAASRASPEEALRALFAGLVDEANETGSRAGPIALPAFVEPLLDGLDGADAHALDARLRRAVALEQRREAELGSLLLRVARGRLYRRCGYTNLPDYARERLGLAAGKAWALLRLERGRGTCPAVFAAYRAGRLSWVKAQALLGLVGRAPLHGRAWVDWALRVTVRRLRDDVDRAGLLAEQDPEAFARTGGVPEQPEASEAMESTGVQTGAQPREAGATHASGSGGSRWQWAPPGMARVFFTAPADVARLFRATLCTVQRALARRGGPVPAPGDALDAILEHCFEAWGIRDPQRERDRKKRYRIFERDGWRCAVPGCTSYRNLHAHHVKPRSQGGGEEDENQITLCAWHHLRGVHDQRSLRITGRMPDAARFELGVRPDGPPLAVYASGDVLV